MDAIVLRWGMVVACACILIGLLAAPFVAAEKRKPSRSFLVMMVRLECDSPSGRSRQERWHSCFHAQMDLLDYDRGD